MRSLLPAAMMFTLASCPRAEAAWLICDDMIESAAITAKTEVEAKSKALADWVTKAGSLGIAYTRWQLAWNHQLTCQAVDDGARCIARGRPCRVSQVPPPAGSEVLKPND